MAFQEKKDVMKKLFYLFSVYIFRDFAMESFLENIVENVKGNL